MAKRVKSKVISVGIIGAGRFGTGAAQELIRLGHEVLVVDTDAKALQPLAESCHTAIGDAENIDFLMEVGFKNLDAVIIAIGDNETSSNHATINCKDFGLYVVAKAMHIRHGKILERLGADRIVYPEYDSGVRLARVLARPSVLEMIELYDEVFMMEVQAGGKLANRDLSDLNLPLKFGVQIVLIQRNTRTIFPVTAADIIQQGDKLVCIGSSDNLNLIAHMCQ